MNRDHSVIFETAPNYCILDSLVDYDGYFISSKGFLPTLVDVMIIWIKFTHPVHFSSPIPKMSMFILAISCLTTSNLPWFTYLTFQRFLCNIAVYSIGLHVRHQSHPQLSVGFALANRWENNRNSERLYFEGLQKSLHMVTAAMKLKDICSLEEKLSPT